MYNRVNGSNYPGSSALGVLPPLKCPDNLSDAVVDDSIKRAIKEIGKDLRWYQENNENNTVLGAHERFPPQIPGLKLNLEQASKVKYNKDY